MTGIFRRRHRTRCRDHREGWRAYVSGASPTSPIVLAPATKIEHPDFQRSTCPSSVQRQADGSTARPWTFRRPRPAKYNLDAVRGREPSRRSARTRSSPNSNRIRPSDHRRRDDEGSQPRRRHPHGRSSSLAPNNFLDGGLRCSVTPADDPLLRHRHDQRLRRRFRRPRRHRVPVRAIFTRFRGFQYNSNNRPFVQPDAQLGGSSRRRRIRSSHTPSAGRDGAHRSGRPARRRGSGPTPR